MCVPVRGKVGLDNRTNHYYRHQCTESVHQLDDPKLKLFSLMAAESDGIIDMHVEDQPIDLSKVPGKKPMPPLIPISLLRSGYQNHSLHHSSTSTREDWRDSNRTLVGAIGGTSTSTSTSTTRKRGRCNESELEHWASAHKLDRAKSVPQLTPLTSLQRNKSMSESRISVTTAASVASTSSTTSRPIPPPSAQTQTRSSSSSSSSTLVSEEQLSTAMEMLNPSQLNDGLLQSSWVYVGYYSQLLHRFQEQEMLRQFALQQQEAKKIPQEEQRDGAIPDGPVHSRESGVGGVNFKDSVNHSHQEEAAEMKRRQTRPLTGKHVRPGTGASPSTLLSLRRKIQARRHHNDD